MARIAIAMVFLLSILGSLCVAMANYDETQVIHVGGKVLCQDCTQSWNDWVNGARPIKGSRVSVTCLDERKRVFYYGSDETDTEGQFEMTIERDVYGKKLDPRKCLVRIVSSPDASCNVATNFGGGKKGVWLKQANVRYMGMVKYLLSPFYYTNPMCVDTDNDNDNDGESKTSGYSQNMY
ncbi:hypothetical protein V2J09_012102 [Rumex salicifolius]